MKKLMPNVEIHRIRPWRLGPKSRCSTSLRSQFPMRLLNALRGATPWIADISANPDPFLAQIHVSGPPKYTWSTARAEIASPSKPEKSISNETVTLRPASMLQEERPLESRISRQILHIMHVSCLFWHKSCLFFACSVHIYGILLAFFFAYSDYLFSYCAYLLHFLHIFFWIYLAYFLHHDIFLQVAHIFTSYIFFCISITSKVCLVQ